jgi:hypothetical protein
MPRKFHRSVRSIIIVSGDDGVDRVAVYRRRRRRGRKRGSRILRPVQKLVRRLASAQETFSGKYLRLHDRSNREYKNGWLREIVSNTARAISPAARKITRR